MPAVILSEAAILSQAVIRSEAKDLAKQRIF